MPVYATLQQLLLETLQDGCVHPGQQAASDNNNNNDAARPASRSNGSQRQPQGRKLPYAGCRVLLLPSGSPQEIGRTPHQPAVSMIGGVGGRCTETGQRFHDGLQEHDGATPNGTTGMVEGDSNHENHHDDDDDPEAGISRQRQNRVASRTKSLNDDDDDTDIVSEDATPDNLRRHYPQAEPNVAELYNELGIQCAEAAVGVDILFVLPSSVSNTNVGIPFLRLLAERSGAPGPVVFALPTSTNGGVSSNPNNNNNNVQEMLYQQVLNRTPWYRPNAFGAWMRLRLSQGFVVDTTPLTQDRSNTTSIAPFLLQQGLVGPASASTNDEEENEAGLWYQGVCDDHQTVCIDLQVTNRIQRFAQIDGMGDVALKHCMQLSYAFTTIVYNEESGQYETRRILRVVSLHTPLASHTEQLYASVSPSALATVLYHKLALSACTDGLVATQAMGQSWLKFLLVCLYQSGHDYYQQVVKRQTEYHVTTGTTDVSFFPNERLLSSTLQGNSTGGGTHDKNNNNINDDNNHDDAGKDVYMDNQSNAVLTDTAVDILMAQGHDQLCLLPLLVWGLLQSEALRPNNNVPLDTRSAAAGQLASMPPHVLMHCLIPSLALYDSNNLTEPLVDGLDPSHDTIALHVMDQGSLLSNQYNNKRQPSSVLLLLLVDSPQQIVVSDTRHFAPIRDGKDILRKDNDDSIRNGLDQIVQKAASRYRTSPPIIQDVDNEMAMTPWSDVLLQDAPDAVNRQLFTEWKAVLATEVHDELEDE